MPKMVILFVTLKNELVANVIAWTHTSLWVGTVFLLQFGIEFLVYHRNLNLMFHLVLINCNVFATAKIQLFQKKYPLDSFLFLYPWLSKSLAVSDCFHSAKTLPLAERMMFMVSMMLGMGYSPVRRMENSMAKMRW